MSAAIQDVAQRLSTASVASTSAMVRAEAIGAFTQAVERGRTVSEALDEAHADARVGEALALAKPGDAVSTLNALITPITEHAEHVLRLRASVLPGLLALVTVSFASVMVSQVALPALHSAAADIGATLPGVWLSWLGPVVSLVLLAVLLGSIVMEAPWSLVASVRRDVDRALVFSAASAFVLADVALPLALSAAGRLARDRQIAAAALEASQSLSAGQAPAAGALLEAGEARMVFSLAGRGAGAPALTALAAHLSAANRTRVLLEQSRVNVWSLAIAGVGLATASISLFVSYAALIATGHL